MSRSGQPARRTKLPLLLLGLCLIFPSCAIAQKYLGLAGVLVYVVVVTAVLVLGRRFPFERLSARIPEWLGWSLTVVVLLGVVAIFFVVYPLADSGALGSGSDRDEALDLAVRSLLSGEYPYYERTYLDNPISPMPGAVFLSMPFVLLGSSAYQNVLWLPVFVVVMYHLFGDVRKALLLFCLLLAMSPILLQEIVTGGDLLANSIYVMVFALWTVESARKSDAVPTVIRYLPAVLLGIGLSSRANLAFLLPLIFFSMGYACGWRRSIRHTLVAGVAFALVTAPFYFYDPEGFTPLQTTNRFDQFDSMLPVIGTLLPLAILLFTVAVATLRSNREVSGLLVNCAIVLAVPILIVTVLYSIKNGGPNFEPAFYGIPFAVFGSVGAWLWLSGRETEGRVR